MRHAVMVALVAMRALPRREGRLVPRTTRAVAGAMMAWLDRRRRRIDTAGAPS